VKTNADEIRSATQSLGFTPARFRILAPKEAAQVYQSALRHFVPTGQPRWWWEHFRACMRIDFSSRDGWKHLSEFVPDPDERVWFIAEDIAPTEYSVWEATTRDVQDVIGECSGFEFYLVQHQFRWLLCENHHNVVIGVGREVEDRLRHYGAA
jgi:hypothetical protein